MLLKINKVLLYSICFSNNDTVPNCAKCKYNTIESEHILGDKNLILKLYL